MLQPHYSDDRQWWWDGHNWVPAAQASAPGQAYGSVVSARYAGFWIRFVAWLIDAILLTVVGLGIGFVVGLIFALIDALVSGGSAAYDAAGGVRSLVVELMLLALNWLYFSLLHSSRHQASLGQMAVAIHVVSYNGQRISFARASGRFFASLLSGLICYVGYLMIAFTARKQGLHDLMASTLVVHGRPGAVQPGSAAPAAVAQAGGMVAIAVTAGLILLLAPIVVIVILLTMGRQIENVFSNVVVALGS